MYKRGIVPICPKVLLSYKQKLWLPNADSLHITCMNAAVNLQFESKMIIYSIRLTQMSAVHIYAFLTIQMSRPSKGGGARSAPWAGGEAQPRRGEPPENGETPQTERRGFSTRSEWSGRAAECA